jgi:hypothetical protein
VFIVQSFLRSFLNSDGESRLGHHTMPCHELHTPPRNILKPVTYCARPRTVRILFSLLLLIGGSRIMGEDGQQQTELIPPSWQILPIPRDADYGGPDDFITLDTVAIVRQAGGPYQTVRDAASELVGTAPSRRRSW